MPLYNVSEYERHQWRYQQLVNKSHEHVVNSGEIRFQGFSGFSDEVFHKFVSPEPSPVLDPNPGQDVFRRLHSAMDEIPEVQDLRDRCVHDEYWSAQSTNTILQTLLGKTAVPSTQVKSSERDLGAIKAMERLLKNKEEENAGEETVGKIRDEIERLSVQAAQKAIDNKAYAKDMDITDIRSAIREGVIEANKEIDNEVNAFDAFPGTEGHTGKRARREVAASVAAVLKNNDRLKRIMDLAGRLRRIAIHEQRKKPRKGVDEYCGIEPGAELERLVPSEWATLDDQDLEPLFMRRMTERSLSQFEITARETEQQGPIVFLLDSSGSMEYYNCDAWAAAVAMAFMQIAILQKRSFAIVHFGSEVLRTDRFNKNENIDHVKIADSVSFFASAGGTNFMAPLDRAVEIISREGGFKKADIIMCTDGKASIERSWLEQYKEYKDTFDFSTFSIMVGPESDASINEKFSDDVVHLKEMLVGDDAMHRFFQAV